MLLCKEHGRDARAISTSKRKKILTPNGLNHLKFISASTSMLYFRRRRYLSRPGRVVLVPDFAVDGANHHDTEPVRINPFRSASGSQVARGIE